MLVLSRRIGEEIVIQGDIRVTVLEVQGQKVRIGVAAPASVRVDRAEIHERRTDQLIQWQERVPACEKRTRSKPRSRGILPTRAGCTG